MVLFSLAPLQGTPARLQVWNPDSSLSFELPTGTRFVRQPAAVEGSLHLFQDREHPASMIVVSFFPNTNLQTQMRTGHEQLLRLVPNKRVEPLKSPAFQTAFARAGLKHAAFAYPSTPTGGKGGSICDAAAVHWETAGGVWTVSANGDLGSTQSIQRVLEEFVNASALQNLNQPARIGDLAR